MEVSYSLLDLKAYYIKKSHQETITFLTNILVTYFRNFFSKNIIITLNNSSSNENSVQFGFEVRYDSKSIYLDFVFEKDTKTYQREIIIANIYLYTPDKKVIQDYIPKSASNLRYLNQERTISFDITITTPKRHIEGMKCNTIFEIGLYILLGRTTSSKLN